VSNGIGGSGQDLVSKLGSIVVYLGQVVSSLQSMLPRITGTFTMAAAATKTVTDARINANGVVWVQATNAAAGTLQGSAKSLFVSNVASGSFTVETASGGNAVGTETFSYTAFNPI
jgi:exosome complex RNA-binding protein Rrp4